MNAANDLRNVDSDRRVRVELCAGGIDDVRLAAECRVDRIELNCGVALGGLTPSSGLLQSSRQIYSGPIIAMLRPREGGFCYSGSEFEQILLDAECLLALGADGLAAGFLQTDGRLDVDRVLQLRRRFPQAMLVFHRAFDVLPDLSVGLQQLLDCGWNRILTSGGQPTALAGAAVLRGLREQAGDRMEILPAGGIRSHNLQALVEVTGVNQVHSAVLTRIIDPSTGGSRALQFGASTEHDNGAYTAASEDELKRLLQEARLIAAQITRRVPESGLSGTAELPEAGTP